MSLSPIAQFDIITHEGVVAPTLGTTVLEYFITLCKKTSVADIVWTTNMYFFHLLTQFCNKIFPKIGAILQLKPNFL